MTAESSKVSKPLSLIRLKRLRGGFFPHKMQMNTAALRTKANLKIVREQNGIEHFSTRGADEMLTLSQMKYSCVDF